MCKKLTSVLILVFSITISCWSQVLLTGTVISQTDSLAIPGVIVMEKGTNNSTTTNYDGYYAIEVSDTSTLEFSFVGMVTRELPVNGKNEVNTLLKEAMMYEAWDQKIGLHIMSGIINNPLGGQVDFSAPLFNNPSAPPLVNGLSIKTSIGYQTNLDHNYLITGDIRLHRIRLDPDVWLNLGMYYTNIRKNDAMDIRSYSIESALNTMFPFPISLILGYGNLRIEDHGSNDSFVKQGITIGSDFYIPSPINMSVLGKTSLYKGSGEYQVELQRDFGRITSFARYYNVESYTEVSIGLGVELTYYFKYQRNAYTYE